MAINKKLIHFKNKEKFNTELANNNILDTSICFIQDTKEIWTHGQLYDGNIGIQAVDDEGVINDGTIEYATKAYVDLLLDRIELLETILSEIIVQE